LAGSIPSTLGRLVALTTLDLGVNSLTASLPTELALLTRLETLYVNNNYLTGPVLPDATSVAWPQLVRLNIDETQLGGTIASSIVEHWSETLQELYIGRSAVEFTIPKTGLNLPQLTTLNIASPASGGPFPNVVDMLQLGTLLVPRFATGARCPNLDLTLDHLIRTYTHHAEELTLTGTLFTGSLPSNIGLWTNLQTLSLNHVSVEGTIPKQIAQCTSLETVTFLGTKLSGTIPVEMATLPLGTFCVYPRGECKNRLSPKPYLCLRLPTQPH
jgi:Leucine-rich repeat (LRR) protein